MADHQPHSGGQSSRVYDSSWVVGTLLEHGRAHYQFDESNSMSYFARLRTAESEQGARRRLQEADQDARPLDGRSPDRVRTPDDGGVRVLWGTDLKRAIERSKSGVKLGQLVAIRVIGREPVQFGPDSGVPREQQRTAYRNRYEVERPQFVKRRVQFARRANETYQGARREGVDSPEALALYLIHDGARRLAEMQYPDPADQQRFLARVRNFFEVSPDREAVIARAVANLEAKRSPARSPATTHETATESTSRTPQREPRVRE